MTGGLCGNNGQNKGGGGEEGGERGGYCMSRCDPELTQRMFNTS